MPVALALILPVLKLYAVVALTEFTLLSRKVPGPHIAFYIPGERWREAIAHLDNLGIPHGDRGAAKERQEGQGGTYMDDPAGYVIQFITDGME